MVVHEKRCIFVHIPKTAGQSIEHFFLNLVGLDWRTRRSTLLGPNDDPALGPPRLAHLTAEEYTSCGHMSKVIFNNYYKFSFVRNPWDRIISSYKFRGFSDAMDFKTFLFTQMPEPGWTSIYRHFVPQYDYLYSETGDCLVDFVGKFEMLQNDFDEVCVYLGIENSQLPHVNKARKAKTDLYARHNFEHYTDYYDEESKQFVADLYSKDIETFGYEFEH